MFPDRRDLRPTLGRVRETLFNWLRAEVAGSRCLDLYAGSGALGFEAASLGAAAVTLVESDRRAAAALEDNARRLGADNVTVLRSRGERVLERRSGGPWDIIFVDPPFTGTGLAPALDLIDRCEALAPGGVIYVEAPRRGVLPSGPWRRLKQAHAGDTQFGLLAAP